jgi:hypothetical protein
MFFVPMHAAEECLGQVGLAVTVLELAADVVVEKRDVGRRDGRGLRIVFGSLAEGIEGGAGETRVETTGSEILIILEGLGEFAARDAEVGLDPVCDGKACVFVELLGDRLLLGIR